MLAPPPEAGPQAPSAAPSRPAANPWRAVHWLWAAWEALLLAAAVGAAYLLRAISLPLGQSPPPAGPYLAAAGLWATLGLGAMALWGGYRTQREGRPVDEAILGLLAAGSAALGSAFLAFAYRGFSFSRLAWALAFLLAALGLGAGRWAFATWRQRAQAQAWGQDPVLVASPASEAEALQGALAQQGIPSHHHPCPEAPPGNLDPRALQAQGRRFAQALAEAAAQAGDCHTVWVAWPGAAAEAWAGLAEGLAERRLTLKMAPGPVATWVGQGRSEWLGLKPAARLAPPSWRSPWRLGLKRGGDVVLAALGLLVAGPFLLVLMLAVRLGSPGPALYRQERLGQAGRRFQLLKLRTMPLDAEADGPVWAAVGDERATPLGAWLRRSSLDELPQLWNVLRGDMSLVGPRPERPAFHERFCEDLPEWPRRLALRPGLTGWAQVHGLRGDVPLAQRLALDLAYLEGWSLALDWRILALTLGALWRNPGR